MNQAVKQKWCAALRSGEYRQCKGRLKRKEIGVEEFCCLGILCDIYSKETGTPWRNNEMFDDLRINYFKWLYLPDTVKEWADLLHKDAFDLASLNDDGKSFEEIADYIETSL